MKLINGKKIIDLSRIIVGPHATQILADFGCDVIKIEAPEGDPTRLYGPPWHQGESAYYLSINRNKRSLCLNLKQPKCREVLYKLISKADAFIENFVPGVTTKLQIDYDTLNKINPSLVYCSVSGFGDIGSKSSYPAFDNIIQAETGFMHLTGTSDGPPFKMGFAIADLVTSLYAANALLGGLMYKEQTGKGIHLKTSLYECAVAALINQGSNYLNGGINPERIGNQHQNLVPYGVFKTKTLPIIICVGTPPQYLNLLRALKIEPRQQLATNQLRIQNREQCDAMINDALKDMDMQSVIQLLQESKVPCGRVNDLKHLFEGKTVEQLGLVEQVGSMRFVRNPIRTSENNIAKMTAPPKFNEHGRQILSEMGMSQMEILEIQALNKKDAENS